VSYETWFGISKKEMDNDRKLNYKCGTIQQFWDKVDKTSSCWNYTAYRNELGYGKYTAERNTMYAHRFSYMITKGDIPQDMTLDHLCKNPSCVNPEHLEIVTMKENCLRGDSPPSINSRKTHCPIGHPLIGDNLYLHPKENTRECRICRDARNKIYYDKNKQYFHDYYQRKKLN